MIAGRAGAEVQAKILPLSDGGFYVSWFDNTEGGYDVRLQRLDVDGRRLWAPEGLLVADRSFSWTTDYGFAVDADDHAVLSFQCCVQDAADEHLRVVRVAPDGSFDWSGTGVTVSAPGTSAAVSRVAVMEDGHIVVAWMDWDGNGRAQRLDAAGQPQWSDGGIVIEGPAAGSRYIADVQPGGHGDAIVAWSNQPSFFIRILYAQRLAAVDGSALWGQGVRVSEAGNLQAGYFPPFSADGKGGAVFAWYDQDGQTFTVRVQHLDAGGTRLYGDNGVLAATDGGRDHLTPASAYDPATGDTYVAWVVNQNVNLQSLHSLRVQRIDAAGQRRWGDNGIELVPPAIATTGVNALVQPVVLPTPEGVIVAWQTGAIPATAHPVRAQYVDRDGKPRWPAPVDIKTGATTTSRLTGANSHAGYAAFVWSDAPGFDEEGADVLGQNLVYDAGPEAILFADGFEGQE